MAIPESDKGGYLPIISDLAGGKKEKVCISNQLDIRIYGSLNSSPDKRKLDSDLTYKNPFLDSENYLSSSKYNEKFGITRDFKTGYIKMTRKFVLEGFEVLNPYLIYHYVNLPQTPQHSISEKYCNNMWSRFIKTYPNHGAASDEKIICVDEHIIEKFHDTQWKFYGDLSIKSDWNKFGQLDN